MTIEDLQDYDFDYKIDNVQAYPEIAGELDVVYNIYYTLFCHDPEFGDDYSSRVTGSQELVLGDINNMIPFEDLTEELVITWLTDALGQDGEELIKMDAAIKLNELLNPSSVTLKLLG
jgi:hypothetical protein